MADVNRFILKYAYPITFVILAILAWVVYRQFSALRPAVQQSNCCTLRLRC